MPIHQDWQELYRSFVEQYGGEKGEEAFYAYCKKQGIDYTKPQHFVHMPNELSSEIFIKETRYITVK